jgi:hypothetical protein
VIVGPQFSPSQENNYVGVQRVQKLFAKAYGVYQLSDTHVGYDAATSPPPADVSSGDLTGANVPTPSGLASGVPSAPVVKQVVFDPTSRLPQQGNNGFTLQTSGGNFSSGNVVLTSPAPVSALFYAYNPNGEQMPLTEVRVDWKGDRVTMLSGAEGKYKNHKHMCEPAVVPICVDAANFGKTCTGDQQCNATPNSCDLNHTNPRYTFGDSSQACVDDSQGRQGYFAFTRVYTCSTSSANYQANAIAPGQGACVFTPAVFVRDNWGWCTNGNWDTTPATGSCRPDRANGWLSFSGQVLVRP